MHLKLFRVTKREFGWNFSEETELGYFMAGSYEGIEAYIIQNYGPLKHYYRMDEVESQINIEEIQYRVI